MSEDFEGGPESGKRRRKQPETRRVIIGSGVPPELGEALGALLNPFGDDGKKSIIDEDVDIPKYVRSLRSLAEALERPYNYAAKDIVRFKPGLNHTRLQGMMICQEVLPRDKAVRAVEDPNIAGYCDLQDVRVGVLVRSNQFYEFMVDGRRLEKVSEEELTLEGV